MAVASPHMCTGNISTDARAEICAIKLAIFQRNILPFYLQCNARTQRLCTCSRKTLLLNAIAIFDAIAGLFDSRTHDRQTKEHFDRARCRCFGGLTGHRMMPGNDFIKRRSAGMAIDSFFPTSVLLVAHAIFGRASHENVFSTRSNDAAQKPHQFSNDFYCSAP
jgi:hypothetical protein